MGRLPRRGLRDPRRAGQGLQLAADLLGLAHPARQGVGPVPQQRARQGGVGEGRLPGVDPARCARHGVRGHGREHLHRARGRRAHAPADGRDPRRDQSQVDPPDRPRPRLRGGGARPRPRRALPRRRGVPVRHRRGDGAGLRDRRPPHRRGSARGTGDPRRSRACSSRRCTAATSATGSGWTWSRSPPAAPPHDGPDRALRHHPARRHAGRGHVAVGGREAARRPPARRAGAGPHRGRIPQLQPQGAGAVRAPRPRALRARPDLRLRDDPPARGGRRRRPGAARDRRLLRPGVHAGGQDLGPAPREGGQGRPRGEPAHDRRVRGVPAGAGQAGHLRRRALLRRLRRRPRLRAAMPARGGGGGRRDRGVLRHQRRHASTCRGRRDGRRRVIGGRGRSGGDPHP